MHVTAQDKTPRDNLEGWVPELATPGEVRAALEKAFGYRGDVTITLKNGQRVEGYVFDRRIEGASLDRCWVRLYPKGRDEKVSIPYGEIARLEFSGRDTAAGKTFERWIQSFRERKARGEKNISLEPESLD